MTDRPTEASPAALYEAIDTETGRVVVGNDVVVQRLLVALLTDGHVFLEGVPGIAKTLSAKAFARASGLSFNRIQMTPDLLPGDITGTTIYRDETGEFEIQRGPVFSNIVLADEINRATPKTQSALLEAMQERQVTIEDETLPLPEPFLVIATQNPIEMEGVYELPEAQRDRFQFKIRSGYPSHDDERAILDRFGEQPQLDETSIEQVVDPDAIAAARTTVNSVFVADEIKEYILALVGATRDDARIEVGASPRAGLHLLHASKAQATISGRDYVIPDDVKRLAVDTLAHRLVLSTDAELSSTSRVEVIEAILDDVATPSGDAADSPADTQSGGSTHSGAAED